MTAFLQCGGAAVHDHRATSSPAACACDYCEQAVQDDGLESEIGDEANYDDDEIGMVAKIAKAARNKRVQWIVMIAASLPGLYELNEDCPSLSFAATSVFCGIFL